MITIFIAYASKDFELAKNFKDYLKNTESMKFNPMLVELEKKPSEFFNKQIAYNLENCDVFIPLITKNSLKNRWVNQEIGYAYSLQKRFEIEIIPIVHDRKEINKGFINNQMELPFVWDDDVTKTFEEVRTYMDKIIHYPIELDIINMSETGTSSGAINGFKGSLTFENVSKRKIEHVQLGVVNKIEGTFSIRGWGGLPEFKTGKLPKSFKNNFPDGTDVRYLEIHNIYPKIVGKFDFIVTLKDINYSNIKTTIGFYVVPHGSEPTFYEGVFECKPKEVKFSTFHKTNKMINVSFRKI